MLPSRELIPYRCNRLLPPPHLKKKSKGKLKLKPTVSSARIQAIRETLKRLPPAPAEPSVLAVASEEVTRIDQDLDQLKNARAHFPPQLQYFAVDGAYSRRSPQISTCTPRLSGMSA